MEHPDVQLLRELLPNCLRPDRLRLEVELERTLKRHQGTVASEPIERFLAEARKSIEFRHRRYEGLPQVSYPSNLPITAKKDEIVAAIRNHQVVVIAGETGSGKTTQIPKMCLEAGLGTEGKIGCTQPRRVAALSISRRIADELKVNWGQEVGCKIRFTDRSTPASYIKLMTDGILLAETQGDRDLNEYDAIVIDEAHERSLNIDFLLGHLKRLLPRRPDLKLIITSATIDTKAFSEAFGDAPVLEVSGRTYPVEIRYAPHDPEAEENGDQTYIDAAVSAVENVLLESERGDILVFMPSERDIRETQDDLQGRYSGEAEVVPLFGRLTSGEQDRVFAPSARRKIIVATNIAETSLTIPGVGYVIDTGLARVSRYNPRTRTKRLPIEPISQSSAQQRAGRSGRVENGVCIRLYSEEDWAARPKDTQPEIQRSNLAEVILKMKAWGLGEIETFPFLNPPAPQAIQNGYQLLQELGALDAERALTPLGRDLARLPVDPSIGRMILQSQHEAALSDVLIVASGLSIQDPRDRPLDNQEAADQAHRQFLDPASDFLTLLNIWNAFDAKLESLRTQNQMRRFCKANFISYTRIREWIDVHAQLEEAVGGLGRGSAPRGSGRSELRSTAAPPAKDQAQAPGVRRPAEEVRRGQARNQGLPPGQSSTSPLLNPRYSAIHRSVLAGLLGHIAQRVERNIYRASGNRQIMIWPGSSLFERQGSPRKSSDRRGGSPLPESVPKISQPGWIMAGEIVETSRLFGRTVANISADWIVDLGAHLCKRSYGEPFWEPKTERVLSRERVTLFGLEVQDRAIDYGRVDPAGATELFIRAALVEDQIEAPLPFLEHNRRVRQKIEVWRTRLRNHRLPNIDDALFAFYSRHLEKVSSVHDLNRLVRDRIRAEPNFLRIAETDLTGGVEVAWDTIAFPTEITLADQRAPLEYAYAPGEERDGITVKLSAGLVHQIDPKMLDWIVPGLRNEQIEFLLKALPKSLRVPLMPLAPKVGELAADLEPSAGLDGLRRLIHKKYGMTIPAEIWKRDLLPDHLRPRLAVTGKGEAVVASGRDLATIKQGLEQQQSESEEKAWSRAAQQWEMFDLRTWSFVDPPEQIEVVLERQNLLAFPGLDADGQGVHLKLFRSRAEAQRATRRGFHRLLELALQREFAWVQKDLRALEKMSALYAGWLGSEEILAAGYEHLKLHLFQIPEKILPLTKASFEAAAQTARERIPGLIPKFLDRVQILLGLRKEILQHRAFPVTPSPGSARVVTDFKQLHAPASRVAPVKRCGFLPEELDRLLPRHFLQTIPFDRLDQYPRYLKALVVRADRALLNSAKDLERAQQVRPFAEALEKLNRRADLSDEACQAVREFRWLLEEFKVSVFAQELGTAQSVSPKRLNAQLVRIEELA